MLSASIKKMKKRPLSYVYQSAKFDAKNFQLFYSFVYFIFGSKSFVHR